MVRTLDAKQKGVDDELLYRSTEVKLGGTTLLSGPVRVIDATKVAERTVAGKMPPDRVFEAYKKPTPSLLAKVMSNSKEMLRYNRSWQKLTEIAGSDPFLVFLDYGLKKDDVRRYPSQNELKFMVRTIHAYSTFSTVPMVSSITDYLEVGKSFDSFCSYVSGALDTIESYNKKPVMGVVPLTIPFTKVEELMELYLAKDVSAFALDFAATKPESRIQTHEEVLAFLSDNGVLESSYIHALNISPGRPRSTTPVSLSSNVLSPGYCIDTYGDLHRTKIRTEYEPTRTPPVRLFSRKDYGNHIVTGSEEVESVYPAESSIQVSELSECVTRREIAKLFNAEQQSLEMGRVRRIILDKDEKKGMTGYLARKEQVREKDIEAMRSLGHKMRKS